MKVAHNNNIFHMFTYDLYKLDILQMDTYAYTQAHTHKHAVSQARKILACETIHICRYTHITTTHYQSYCWPNCSEHMIAQ